LLELRYNDDPRRLAGQADKSEFIQTMIELHCELFGITPDQARESAELRVQACNVVDRITGHTSTDVEADWVRAEDYLRQCYRSVERIFVGRVTVHGSRDEGVSRAHAPRKPEGSGAPGS